jgi:hypothetical protein
MFLLGSVFVLGTFNRAEDEFLDVIGTKVLSVFLLAIHSHSTNGLPPFPFEKKWFETGL